MFLGAAQDGREAIEAVKSLKPDVVVMDIGLPFVNGIDAAKQIKEFGFGTKIVMLTSHDDEETCICSSWCRCRRLLF